jgi:hypothetical protein
MSGIGDPSSRYNVLSNWGRLAGKLTEGDYSRMLSSNINLLLSAIKKARSNNKNKGAEGKEI